LAGHDFLPADLDSAFGGNTGTGAAECQYRGRQSGREFNNVPDGYGFAGPHHFRSASQWNFKRQHGGKH
jgi:hypothetical protein